MFNLSALAATPANPVSGRVRVFINASGNLCSVDSAGTVVVYGTGVTAEIVEDIVGALLQDTASVNVTYNDAGAAITMDVLPGGVDHNALLNYVSNQHVDHSTVTITGGTGLTGGGDITTSRTLSIANVGTAGTYQAVTTNAQGQVISGSNPTTLSGYGITDAQPLDGDLTAVAALAGTGLVTRTATNTMTTRTVTAGTGVSVANGDGISGNPTITNTDLGSSAVTTHVGLADPHAQYTLETTTITAGTGLTGGGDLTTNRTISIANLGTAGTYGSATLIPVITTNAQGQVSAVTTVTPALNVPTTRVASTTLVTTTSATAVTLTGMTITPAAGTYHVLGRACLSATSNSRTINVAIFKAGVIEADSEVSAFIHSGNGFGTNTDIANTPVNAVVTVNGSEAIDLRWRTSGGTAQAQGYALTVQRIS